MLAFDRLVQAHRPLMRFAHKCWIAVFKELQLDVSWVKVQIRTHSVQNNASAFLRGRIVIWKKVVRWKHNRDVAQSLAAELFGKPGHAGVNPLSRSFVNRTKRVRARRSGQEIRL